MLSDRRVSISALVLLVVALTGMWMTRALNAYKHMNPRKDLIACLNGPLVHKYYSE